MNFGNDIGCQEVVGYRTKGESREVVFVQMMKRVIAYSHTRRRIQVRISHPEAFPQNLSLATFVLYRNIHTAHK